MQGLVPYLSFERPVIPENKTVLGRWRYYENIKRKGKSTMNYLTVLTLKNIIGVYQPFADTIIIPL